MNAFERLFKILFSPGEVFQDIAGAPKVIVPLIIITLLAAGFTAYYSFNVDAEVIIEKEMDKAPMADRIPQETRDQIISSRAEKFAITTPLWVLGLTPVVFLIIALYLLVVCKIAKREVSYHQLLSIPVYGNAVVIPSAIVGFIIMLLTDFSQTSLVDLLPSNLGYFFNADDVGKPVHSLMKALDFFALWKMVLMTVGLSIITKMDTVKSALVIFVPWALFMTIGIIISSVF